MMRKPFLLAVAITLAALPAQAAPHLLLSAEVDPRPATAAGGQSCPVLLHLRNATREPVGIVGRIEGRLGDGGFPSYRTFSFDSVRPGGVATQPLVFDGDCQGTNPGHLVFRGLLMCHEGLSNYLNCQADLGAERSGGRALDVQLDVTDWDPGGLGTGAAQGSAPGR
jgi:hypothetical protein